MDILCKIHTQGIKLYGKMALFVSLGLLIQFWPLGPILDLLGPISPNVPGEPQLFSGLPDYLGTATKVDSGTVRLPCFAFWSVQPKPLKLGSMLVSHFKALICGYFL